jgi:ribonuclease J
VALAACYPRDVDRLTTLYRAAVDSGRDLVVPFRTAHLLERLADDPALAPPVPSRDPHLKVYRRTKKKYYTWERPFLDTAVDAEWVRTHGREVLLLLDMNQFAELIDLRPPAGSPFIRSMSEPFSEEDGKEDVLQNWISPFGLSFEQFHASGHCSGPELTKIVKGIAPEALYPIHTEHPEAFEGTHPRVISPSKGTSYSIASGREVK